MILKHVNDVLSCLENTGHCSRQSAMLANGPERLRGAARELLTKHVVDYVTLRRSGALLRSVALALA